MKDLIMISSYCDTKEKEDILRNLVNQIITQKDKFDLMIVSHSVVPDDISIKCDLVIYDKKNELLYDWDLRCKPWFNPGDERQIMSIFTGFFNTHLAIWRMLIIGNSVAKNIGYKKIHHIEYDTSIKDFKEIIDNSNLLDIHDCVTYSKTEDKVDEILFGTYQAYRLDTLHENLLVLDEEKLKDKIRLSDNKSPEGMLYSLLHDNKNGKVKNKSVLDLNGNFFGISHGGFGGYHTAWCLPYFDALTSKLGFVIWNMENKDKSINVKLIYNDNVIITFGDVLPQHWKLKDIDDFGNAEKLTVILDNKVRNVFDFKKNGDMFKQVSFREKNNKN
jgi:hypothetical protein